MFEKIKSDKNVKKALKKKVVKFIREYHKDFVFAGNGGWSLETEDGVYAYVVINDDAHISYFGKDNSFLILQIKKGEIGL